MRFNFGFCACYAGETQRQIDPFATKTQSKHKASGAGTGVEQAGGGARTIGLTARVNFIKARVIPPQSRNTAEFKTSKLQFSLPQNFASQRLRGKKYRANGQFPGSQGMPGAHSYFDGRVQQG